MSSMRIRLPFLSLLLILLYQSLFSQNLGLDPEANQINAVRFDPSYYYDSDLEIKEMAQSLLQAWKSNGINTVFYKVYDPAYGAKYVTDYQFNIMADYGKQDLLSHIINAARETGDMQIIAWIPAFLHKSAWENNPDWRVKNSDGSDYQPNPEDYFLCPANDQVRSWWMGFIKDILDNYPDLDGVDIAEPIVKWNDHRCYGEQCSRSEDPLYTSKALTKTLNESVELINSYNKLSCITSVVTANANGRLLTIAEQQLKSGFYLDGVLDYKSPPDWINLELMWQQWADYYNAPNIFTPEWTTNAAKTVVKFVDDRATLIAHLEQTSFGQIKVDAEQLNNAIQYSKDAGIEHVDIYDTHLLDEMNAWSVIKPSLEYVPTKNILVLTDPSGENDAKQIASLLSHFKTNIEFIQLGNDIQLPAMDSLQTIFYIGIDEKFQIPNSVLTALKSFDGDLCWINYGVDQYIKNIGLEKTGFYVNAIHHDSLYQTVPFKGYDLPRFDPSYVETTITDSSKCRVLVEMQGNQGSLPYVIKSSNLWYFADLPTAFVTEGGRHIVISDMLHDIVREDHKPKKLALIRIEDIHPISDIKALEQVTGYLKSQDAPYSIGIVPYYLDPESNLTATLNDMPDFVDFVHKSMKSGATIIMHGSTHQFRGETTADYEFWDGMTEEVLFSDSKEYVRQKLLSGLQAFKENGIYPIIWETPHYAASQMDYGVINKFFNTAYERRQTVDKHGSDQLLPYMIYNHTAGNKIIPENLGYIPLDDPNPAPMLQAAEHNLAIRDGVASFFFHTFVDHNALKTIVPGLKKMGYTFTSPRYTASKVIAPEYQALTGDGSISLTLDGQYYHEFYMDIKGRKKNEFYSDSSLTETINKDVKVPTGWIFIAEKLDDKPKGLFARAVSTITPNVPELSETIFNTNSKSLIDEGSFPISAGIIVDSTATGPAGISQNNLIKSLQVVGIDVQILPFENLIEIPDDINMLVVPKAAADRLTEQQNLFISYALQNGLNVVFEKHSNIANNIGIIELDQEIVINNVYDEYYPGVNMTWKTPDTLRAFDVDIDYVSYYSIQDSGDPVVIGGEYGEGKYLFMGTLFDPITDYGYARFPYFIDLLKRQFNLVPTVRRNTVEIYFEPGDREDISIEELVKMWRNFGVRRIYVSTWHFYEEYTYDYERLIELAHQNAMLVYAWLEIPHVSQKFWDKHPEWREITATGEEAHIDWRRNMAVDLPECRQAIFDELQKALLEYDWDGINFAELYYESPEGFKAPQNMTPMNDYVRNMYSQKYGYDPKSLFATASPYYWKRNKQAVEQFQQFREDRVFYLHGEFLKFMHELRRKNGREWEILVTTLENIFSPEIGKATATNTKRILQWIDEYPFTIQIEDPQPLWALGPERYTKILDEYSSLDYHNNMILDINVVPWRDTNITLAPTRQPTGLELFQLAKAASANNTRVAVYSEASLYEVDFPMLTYVFANNARESINNNEWLIETPYTVNTLLDRDAHKDIMLNGVIWPAYYQGRAIIPAGLHKIQPISRYNGFIKKFKSDVRLVELSGELLDAQSISRGIEITYRSDAPNILVLSENPISIIINEEELNIPAIKGELGYSLRLPAGEHTVTIYTQTNGTQTLKYTSVVISGMIVILGILAGLFLSTLYLQNTIRRKRASI